MISTQEALAKLFVLASPGPVEYVALRDAADRVLAEPVFAQRDQPPFAASAMDGYAVQASDVAHGNRLMVIGEAAAGHAYAGTVRKAQAVRIFTGAPLPAGADRVIIQEDVTRQGDQITLGNNLDTKSHVRPACGDFRTGEEIAAPTVITPAMIALLAAMNIANVPVRKKPDVAIIATGDELVQPGETPGPDQIIASNCYGLAALVEAHGANARVLPIARDTRASLTLAFDLAQDADLIVTIGGAAVGDHDLVGPSAQEQGLDRAFYKIAMRPGKPLMAGKMGTATMIGLPGNPVSAMVCGHIFVLPVLRKMLGLGEIPPLRQSAKLRKAIGANGPREHYARAQISTEGVTVFDRQDSALLSVLASANCLAIRPINDPARQAGDSIVIIML